MRNLTAIIGDAETSAKALEAGLKEAENTESPNLEVLYFLVAAQRQILDLAVHVKNMENKLPGRVV